MRTSPLILVPHQTYEVGQVERLSMKRNEKDQTIFTKNIYSTFFYVSRIHNIKKHPCPSTSHSLACSHRRRCIAIQHHKVLKGQSLIHLQSAHLVREVGRYPQTVYWLREQHSHADGGVHHMQIRQPISDRYQLIIERENSWPFRLGDGKRCTRTSMFLFVVFGFLSRLSSTTISSNPCPIPAPRCGTIACAFFVCPKYNHVS